MIVLTLHKNHMQVKTERRVFPQSPYTSSVNINILREENQPTLRKEDLLRDPFFLPQMRKLIGYILILSWDCHFLCDWPVQQKVDSYRVQGEGEQTRILESGGLHAWCLRLEWVVAVCCSRCTLATNTWGKDWKSHQPARASLKARVAAAQRLQTNGFTWCDRYLMQGM